MEFDINIMKLSGEMKRFPPDATAEEKAEKLKAHFEKSSEIIKAKMLFFIILHTKLEIKEMSDIVDEFYHLFTTDLNISLNDLYIFIKQLNLITAFSDIISTCPALLSINLLKLLCDEIIQSENKNDYCKKLAIALYDKYYKISYKFHDESDLGDSVFDLFNLFMPYKSAGVVPKSVLNDIICQIEIWWKILQLRRISDIPAFRFSLDNSKNVDPVSVTVDKPTEKTIEMFKNFLSHFRNNYEDFEDDSPKRQTLCENVINLYEAIKGRNLITMEDEDWLESIKIKELYNCDMTVIINKIENCENDKSWFKLLIKHLNWFDNEEAVNCVSKHLNAIDSDDLKSVMDSLLSTNCSEKLWKLYLNCFERIPSNDQIFYFDKYFDDSVDIRLEMAEEELIEKFNKFAESDPKMKTWLLTTCMKSPVKTVYELCKMAISNCTVLERCIEHLKMLKKGCLSPGEEDGPNVITQVVKRLVDDGELCQQERLLLVLLIAKLEELKMLDFKLVNICILKSIETGLIDNKFDKVIFGVELFKSAVKWETISHSERVVLLAFAIRILSHFSWDCCSFSMELVQARQLVLSIIDSLMEFSDHFTDVEIAWLRREILQSSELNQLYFVDFLYSDNLKLIASKDIYVQLFAMIQSRECNEGMIDCFVTQFENKKFLELRSTLIYALIKLLPILTAREWTVLFKKLKLLLSKLEIHDRSCSTELVVFDLLTVSMYCLAEDLNRHGDISSCFEFCVRNYGKLIQKHFLSNGKVGAADRVELAKKILFLLNGIERHSIRKANSVILSSVMLGLTECKTTDRDEEDSLRSFEQWFRRDFIEESDIE